FDLAAAANAANPSPLAMESLEFGLSVYAGGQVSEVFSGLSLYEPGNPRYVVEAVNQSSRLIRVSDLHSTTPWPRRLPDPLSASLTRGLLRLSGGGEGVAALRPEDFTGSQSGDEKRGLRALEDVNEVSIVAIPDALIKPAPPPQRQIPQKPEPIPCLP